MEPLHRLLHVAVVAFVCATCAHAQEPSLEPAVSDTANTQAGNPDQPKPQPPINITVTSPQPSPEATQRDEQRQERNVTAQEEIRDFTWALTILAFAQAGITLIALLYAIRSANAAKRSSDTAAGTLAKMDEIAKAQTADMRASIDQATKAAIEMSRIAGSLEGSLRLLGDTLGINKDIARAQKLIIVLQNRAYIEIVDWKVYRAIDEYRNHGHLVTPRDCEIRFFVRNKGHIVAHIRQLHLQAKTLNLSVVDDTNLFLEPGSWVQRTFAFALPKDEAGGNTVLEQVLHVSVSVDYSDAFAARTKRFSMATWAHALALVTNENKEKDQYWMTEGDAAANGETEHQTEWPSAVNSIDRPEPATE